MQRDERDLLDVLKFELNFLEKGGYGRSPREPWRPQFIFEDSPTCMNYDSKQNPEPCAECVLMHLVPQESRELPVPCRHIPFNEMGETLDSLYRHSDQQEIEHTVRTWLKAEIARLEQERARLSGKQPAKTPEPEKPSKGMPLGQEIDPKCANPACPKAFHWHEGGKFFRFRPEPAPCSAFACAAASTGVKHYWLCEECCHRYTLVHTEGSGVMVKPIYLELPLPDDPKAPGSSAVSWRSSR